MRNRNVIAIQMACKSCPGRERAQSVKAASQTKFRNGTQLIGEGSLPHDAAERPPKEMWVKGLRKSHELAFTPARLEAVGHQKDTGQRLDVWKTYAGFASLFSHHR
jgi:hypothetical protein